MLSRSLALLLIFSVLNAPCESKLQAAAAAADAEEQLVLRDCEEQYGLCKYRVGRMMTLEDGLHRLLTKRYGECLEFNGKQDVVPLDSTIENLRELLTHTRVQISSASTCTYFVTFDSPRCFDSRPSLENPDFSYCLRKLNKCVKELLDDMKKGDLSTTKTD